MPCWLNDRLYRVSGQTRRFVGRPDGRPYSLRRFHELVLAVTFMPGCRRSPVKYSWPRSVIINPLSPNETVIGCTRAFSGGKTIVKGSLFGRA